MHRREVLFLYLVLLVVPATAAQDSAGKSSPAQTQTEGSSDLAKKLTNPVSDMVSVPFQANWDNGVGPNEDTRFILNIQPVLPFSLTRDWNLIARVITPLISQPPLGIDAPATFGVGDVLMSAFLSPAHSRRLIWGVGPVLNLPSTADPYLGSGKWSAGPTFVALKQSGGFTYGALLNQIWSFSGSENRKDVSQMFLQPFFAYTTKQAVTFSINSEMTANWKAPSGERWTVPLMFQISKVSSFGPFPASYFIGAAPFIEKPEGGPSWRLRAGFALILPRQRK